jgi:tetratricopeptide (TPR) repeat protein
VTQQVTNWLARHPDDRVVVPAVAGSLMISGNAEALKMAEDLLRGAIQRDPKWVQPLSSLALLMQSTDRTAEASALNRQVLELDPNNVIALNNLAWVLCEEDGRCKDALELADRGLKVAPDYADLLDTRGVALYHLGELEKAAADFARCVELYPANARSAVSAMFHLARTYADMGRTAEAQKYFKDTMDQQSRVPGLSPADLAKAKQLIDQLEKPR